MRGADVAIAEIKMGGVVALAVTLVGCGRVGFEQPLDAGMDGAPTSPDASTDASTDAATSDDAGAGDSGLADAGMAIDAGPLPMTCDGVDPCLCESGSDCALTCAEDRCTPECVDSGTSCTISATGIRTATTLCSEASCRQTCDASVDGCYMACVVGATCVLDCPGVRDCRFTRCDVGAQDCDGGLLVCNQPCP